MNQYFRQRSIHELLAHLVNIFQSVKNLKGGLKLESEVTVLFVVHNTHFNGRVFNLISQSFSR